jgi:hypothetical protein
VIARPVKADLTHSVQWTSFYSGAVTIRQTQREKVSWRRGLFTSWLAMVASRATPLSRRVYSQIALSGLAKADELLSNQIVYPTILSTAVKVSPRQKHAVQPAIAGLGRIGDRSRHLPHARSGCHGSLLFVGDTLQRCRQSSGKLTSEAVECAAVQSICGIRPV